MSTNTLKQTASKFSVLISFHNEKKYFEDVILQAVSIFGSKNIIITLDRAKHKFTAAVINECKYYGIENVHLYNHGNFAKVLNAAILKTDCEYIVRIDGDDMILPRRLDMLNAVIDGNYDFAHSDSIHLKLESATLYYYYRKLRFFKAIHLLKIGYNPIVHPTVIYKRSLMANIKYVDVERAEDFYTWIKLSRKLKVLNYKYPTIIYRSPSIKRLKQPIIKTPEKSLLLNKILKWIFKPRKINI